jgi:hypothetical protein
VLVQPIENRQAALWMSAATEVIARTPTPATPAAATAAQAMITGIEQYVRAFEKGDPIDPPLKGDEPNDPDAVAYLAQLFHRLAHAKLIGDVKLSDRIQKEIEVQTAHFTHGNPLWQQMSEQYFAYYAAYPHHKGAKPRYRAWNDKSGGNGDPGFGVIEWRLPAKARLLLIGDIGTGSDQGAAVLLAGLGFKPDAILHLGDVYYSGTHFEFDHRFIGLFEAVMGRMGVKVPVFGVPGNHEYFTGNLAYFDWLDGGRQRPLPSQRQHASYFALKSEDDGWQFLGMDTGYFGHSMSVSPEQEAAALKLLNAIDPKVPVDLPTQPLAPPPPMVVLRDDELDWHRRQIQGFPGQSVLLSHHPLYSAVAPCGVAQGKAADGTPDPSDIKRLWVDTDIWRQLGPDFGERAPAWFWAHEHTLNVFQDGFRPPDWPTDPATASTFRPLPKGRCVGYAAIPVQAAEAPYAKTFPVPLKDDALQLGLTDGWYNRGFAILELAGRGQPATASYYQLAGPDPTPRLVHMETFGGPVPTSAPT